MYRFNSCKINFYFEKEQISCAVESLALAGREKLKIHPLLYFLFEIGCSPTSDHRPGNNTINNTANRS